MTEHPTPLADLYKGWDNYQQLLIAALTPLSDEQLELRAAPQLRTIRELVAHIIGARARWWSELMGEGGAEVAACKGWDRDGAPVRGVAELVSGIETTGRAIQESLQSWTSADLEYVYHATRYGKEYSLTRQRVIWHVIEHDLHHGGELSFLLGMHDLSGLDI
ncbi:MAG TPA: DinB family protein [Ktedonobacteraceae bacterium]|nr:DinB family protein [Ktedonobacteraceae bacterium]